MIPHLYIQRDQGAGYYKKEYEGALNDTDVKEKVREYVQNEVGAFYKESVGEWFEKQVAAAEPLEPDDFSQREDALKDITDAFKQGFNECRATADSFHFAGLRDVSDEKRTRAYKLAEAYSFGRMLTYCLESIADIQKGVSPHLLPAQIDLLSAVKLMQDGNQDFVYKPKDQLAHGRHDIFKGLETLDTSFNTNDILLYGDSSTGATAYTYQTQSAEISKRKERALSNSRYAVVQGLLPFLNRLRMSLRAVKELDTDYSGFGRGGELSFIDKKMQGYGFRSPGARDKKDEFAPYKKQGETFQELQASQKLYDEYNRAFKNRLADQSTIHRLIEDKMKATREKEEQDGLKRKQEQEQKEEQGKFIEKWTGVYQKKYDGYKAQYEREYKDAVSKKGLFGGRNVEKQKAKWTKERDNELKTLESQADALGMRQGQSIHDFLIRSDYKTFQQPANQKKLESIIDTAAKRDALANFSGDVLDMV